MRRGRFGQGLSVSGQEAGSAVMGATSFWRLCTNVTIYTVLGVGTAGLWRLLKLGEFVEHLRGSLSVGVSLVSGC